MMYKMKSKIKQLLKESINKNSLGVEVTRPNQELIILRGIPGSGKSSKASSFGSNAKLHSTDDVIEKSGDYRDFFAKMIASNDFSALSKAHSENLANAKASMLNNEPIVIIDNTNIKQNEPKAYVVTALELGYSDDNIKFIDIGTAGLDAETLAKRNKHGVPLEKIKSMIDSHTSQGPMTLKSVLASKDIFSKPKISYSAVVLDDKSRTKLINSLKHKIPKDWEIIAHHMTIKMGELPKEMKDTIGNEVNLTVTKIGFLTNMVLAVQVTGFDTLTGKVPHITIAVNRAEGGKPVMSGDIDKWLNPSQINLTPINLTGVITEIPNK